MNMENSKTSQPRKYVLNLTQRLDLRSSVMLLLKTCLFITRQQFKSNKLKIIAPT